ncbi:MAG: cytochrome c oxidase assembly protein [Acidimicrobiia bacterium]
MSDPSVTDLATGWQLDPAALLVAAVAGGLYALGVTRLRRRGRRWPPARSAAMGAAVITGLVATQSGIGRFDTDRFWIHMVEHALLGMIVPLLAVLSAPLTLALQSAGPATRRTLRQALHAGWARTLAHPVVAWCLFGAGLVILYLTPLLDLSARNGLVHVAVHGHLVASGSLFLAVLVGVDPLPRRPPFAGRLLALVLAVPFHTVIALALITASTPVAPQAYPDLGDQRVAAGLFWGTGEIVTLAVAAVLVRQWWVAEQRAAERDDRIADRAARATTGAT